MAQVFLSIGTNLGNKEENITLALERLQEIGRVGRRSSLYHTEPWGFSSPNTFCNIAVEIETSMQPLPLLQALQTIERDMGRTAKSTNGTYADRIIDIDILLYDNCVIDTPQLTIPHPLMHQRLFVLEPLCEIAPKRLHPILGKSIAQLLKNIKES